MVMCMFSTMFMLHEFILKNECFEEADRVNGSNLSRMEYFQFILKNEGMEVVLVEWNIFILTIDI